MPKETIVSIRLLPEEKALLIESARRQKKSVTGLIRKRLAPDIGKRASEKRRRPTKGERAVFERLIGCVRGPKSLTNEEIDAIVYEMPKWRSA